MEVWNHLAFGFVPGRAGFLEGINSLIQAAKARARGYRTSKNILAMSYLIAGKLDFGLPT